MSREGRWACLRSVARAPPAQKSRLRGDRIDTGLRWALLLASGGGAWKKLERGRLFEAVRVDVDCLLLPYSHRPLFTGQLTGLVVDEENQIDDSHSGL